MNKINYEVIINPDGFWVGYWTREGQWMSADTEPYDSFFEATKFRDFLQSNCQPECEFAD